MHFSHMWQHHLDMGNNEKMLVLFFFLEDPLLHHVIDYTWFNDPTLTKPQSKYFAQLKDALRCILRGGVISFIFIFNVLPLSAKNDSQLSHFFSYESSPNDSYFQKIEASNGSFRLTSLSKEGSGLHSRYIYIYMYII